MSRVRIALPAFVIIHSLILGFLIVLSIITYSPAYTLVPTYECFNRCQYCNFRTDPHQSNWLELEKARETLTSLQNKNVIEILILSGEVHPQSPRRKLWIERIYELAKLALSMGFLPHTNAGVLSYQEMALLKQVNVSLGLMLEQITPKLLDNVHKHAPTKVPELRLQQLQWAGELKIPFTTGILMGIGETKQERKDSLGAIALLHSKYGHIQEVILQPYQPGVKDEFQGNPLNDEEILEMITIARETLPMDITLQIPPNLLTNKQLLLKSLELGITDLGGIVPKDEVNPDYHHQDIEVIKQTLSQQGYELHPRLPVYPQYYSWVLPELQVEINKFWQKDDFSCVTSTLSPYLHSSLVFTQILKTCPSEFLPFPPSKKNKPFDTDE